MSWGEMGIKALKTSTSSVYLKSAIDRLLKGEMYIRETLRVKGGKEKSSKHKAWMKIHSRLKILIINFNF